MTVQVVFKGEKFLAHGDVLDKAIELVGVSQLTPLRVCKIRHSIENEWINTHIKYGHGLVDVFTNEMSEYYIKQAFEALYLGNKLN